MSALLLILGIVLFIGLVLVHEWGHYILARRNGVEVEEFGLFFPPRIKTLTKRNGTEYTLNWLPLGGFVKLKGENDADRRPGSFGAATTWVKAKIMLAGVGMNLIAAFVLLTLVALIGMPKLLDNQFTVASDTHVSHQAVFVRQVEKGSPADKAGLKQGDQITGLGSIACGTPDGRDICTRVKTPDDLIKETHADEDLPLKIEYTRGGDTHITTATLRSNEEVEASKKTDHPKGYLGVEPAEYKLQRSTWSAPVVAIGLLKQFTVLTFQGLGTAISSLFHGDTQKASEQVSGPIGIFEVLRQGTLLGIQYILLIIAIISLSLAIMNVLPIPALDGGRLFVLLVAHALHKPLTKEVEETIHGLGFMLLIGLLILISIVDVNRFF
jgi:regulator of sigma E protease